MFVCRIIVVLFLAAVVAHAYVHLSAVHENTPLPLDLHHRRSILKAVVPRNTSKLRGDTPDLEEGRTRTSNSLHKRAPCLWASGTTAQSLRSPTYANHCRSDKNTKIKFLNKKGKMMSSTFTACQAYAKDKKQCQCDHLLELNEVHRALTPPTLSLSDRKALCRSPGFHQVQKDLKEEINSKNNIRPAMREPNRLKSELIRGVNIHRIVTPGQLRATLDHASKFAAERQQTARRVDNILHKVPTSGLSKGARAAWAKIVPQGKKPNVVVNQHDAGNAQFFKGAQKLVDKMKAPQNPRPAKSRSSRSRRH